MAALHVEVSGSNRGQPVLCDASYIVLLCSVARRCGTCWPAEKLASLLVQDASETRDGHPTQQVWLVQQVGWAVVERIAGCSCAAPVHSERPSIGTALATTPHVP